MYLMTSHGTFVAVGNQLDLIHVPYEEKSRPSLVTVSDDGRFAASSGALAGILPIRTGGGVHLVKDGRFFCAEPSDQQLVANRTVALGWETFFPIPEDQAGNAWALRTSFKAAQWSTTVQDYYPVSPAPRWGFGKPVHARLQAALETSRATYEAVLDEVSAQREALYAVPRERNPERLQPHWDNAWFTALDGALLVSFLLSRRPARYLEIGSGNSTLFARHAIDRGGISTTIISIDPHPRAEIDAICDHMLRRPLEACDPELFDVLEPGDILFFDGSHRVFTNSDTTALFFDILPRLPAGVLVHFHDIFLPADYTPAWNGRLYSEQYLLGAMLLCGAPPFKVILPAYFVAADPQLSARVREIFEARPGAPIPFFYRNDAGNPGLSFWVETV